MVAHSPCTRKARVRFSYDPPNFELIYYEKSELNRFSCAGFYACSIKKIMKAINQLVIDTTP